MRSRRSPAIPRRIMFADPCRRAVTLSCEGRLVAWVETQGDDHSVMVADVGDTGSTRPVVQARAGEVILPVLVWAPGGRYVVMFRDRGGDENYRAFAADVSTGTLRPLEFGEGVRTLYRRASPAAPDIVLLAVNARDRRYFDLLRMDLTTGESSMVFVNPGFSELHVGADLEPRLAERVAEDGTVEVLSREPGSAWRPFSSIPVEDALTTRIERVSADGRAVFLVDARGRDRAELVEVELVTREETVLAADADADIDAVVFDPWTDRPIAASATAARRRWHVVDPAFAEPLDCLLRHAGLAELAVEEAAYGGACVLARVDHSDAAAEYCTLTRTPATTTRLFRARDDLEEVALQPMQPVTVRARDGLELPAYLTLPPGPERPAPLVLMVHGGPYDRDRWGFSPLHQWLASRGYAVLAVNFRGSTGFGKAHVTAADGEWGRAMQDDLVDGVAWAVERGIADPGRIGLYGVSYGGYASLMAAVRDAERFACFVDIGGPSDLRTFMAQIPPYWRSWFAIVRHRLADPGTAAGQQWLAERSPITHVARMSQPLLIAQGLHDVRVRPSESRTIAAALEARGVPVTLAVLPNEGHFVQRAESQLALAALVELFLACHLGGEAEPPCPALNRANAQIEVGGDFLTAELRRALLTGPAPTGTPMMQP